MDKVIVRLESISLQNFKNVANGKLSVDNNRGDYKASILGIYGQNGSGKTALIDALELLQSLLCGRPVLAKFADYIKVDSDAAMISYGFGITMNGETIRTVYEVSLKKTYDIQPSNIEQYGSTSPSYRTEVFKEVVKTLIRSPKGNDRMGRLMDTDSTGVFDPAPKANLLLGDLKKKRMDLMGLKKYCALSSRSFLFSGELLTVIRENAKTNENAERKYYLGIMDALARYGNTELFVVNTATSGWISLNAQPLIFKYEKEDHGARGTMMLSLDKPTVIPQTLLTVVQKIVINMNIVLEQIIPGLTICVKDLGTQLMNGDQVGVRIQLMSKKNNKEIALKYESEGIKKIVSILQLLIVVYNRSSITVAIDELDSGIFEYLLGELLRIISEKGKGQLIFTSHNLRPLETLDKGFVAFTTVNPQNRYVRLNNVKTNNNLRDFYYRDIMLGEQKEQVYEPTNNSEIAFAFREAGEAIGS